MRARAIREFNDLKEGKLRKEGDVFTVSKARFNEINGTEWGQLVEEAVEEESEG